MRIHDMTILALREPMQADDKYRWKNGHWQAEGLVWLNRTDGATLAQRDSGERVEKKASAIFVKGVPAQIGWGVCVDVTSESSCDYRITKLIEYGLYQRCELTWIHDDMRG